MVVQDILDSLDDSLNIKEHLVDRINSTNSSDKDNVKQICLRIGRKLSDDILKKWSMVLTNKAKGIIVDVDKDDTGVFIEFKKVKMDTFIWVKGHWDLGGFSYFYF